MSIAEFLNGLPSYDERNFSNFISKKCANKPFPVYISTKDIPSEQIILNDCYSSLSIDKLHKQSAKLKSVDEKTEHWLKLVRLNI